jgi:ribonuclease R
MQQSNTKVSTENIGKTFEGFVSITKDIDAYVRVPDLEHESVFILNKYINTALASDKVLVEVVGIDEDGMYGKITHIQSRSKKSHTGILKNNPNFLKSAKEGEENISSEYDYILENSDKKTYVTIYLKNIENLEKSVGNKIAVNITGWLDANNCSALLVRDLGVPGKNNTEMLAYAIERGFSDEHFAESKKQAEEISARGITEDDKKNRRDFRDILTFTIDPVDAKDFDDAISFKYLDKINNVNGIEKKVYEIGVHIADVSHYVTPESPLDSEAVDRETSVYLVDRCIPMLPEELSNDLCSLVEAQDRLVMSAVFEIDEDANILNEWYGKALIKSFKRFTYENAQESMDTNGLYATELNILNVLAKKMFAQRLELGALVLETEEVKFKLDDEGHPVDVYVKTRGDTHKLIEEYMLLANRKVSEFITKSQTIKKPICVYRVHDNPDPERMHDLNLFIKSIGEHVHFIDGAIPTQDLNNLLKKLEGRPEKDLLQMNITRSMAKAIYSLENIGHYGLAFEYYSHFTSPIRRYPDVLTHRILQRILEKDNPKDEERPRFAELCIKASNREKDAADAERGSIKYKQIEYMADRLGQTFEATVSGVSKWGIYATDNKSKCEGMIRLRDLGDDFFNYIEIGNYIKGERSGETFKIGDRIKIKVVSADLELKQIDFKLVK